VKLISFIILVLFTNFVFGQTLCNSAKEISASQFDNIKLNGTTQYFKIKKDSSFASLNLKGGFNKITIYQSDNCSKLVVKGVLNNIGVYQPTDSQVDEGYCFCEKCILRLSKIKLNKSSLVLIKIEGGSLLEASTEKIKKPEGNTWFSKTYKTGDRIQLSNIMFIAGTARLQALSFKDLNLLFQLLNENKNLKIEIQGHVNGPKAKNKKGFQQLSEVRAKAVLNFLIKKGIDGSRLNSAGYGNTKMIFPNATTEFKMQFNRRVEILVL
jgi:outer membrane protein OmpA-like peptidoglycan-associated protein